MGCIAGQRKIRYSKNIIILIYFGNFILGIRPQEP